MLCRGGLEENKQTTTKQRNKAGKQTKKHTINNQKNPKKQSTHTYIYIHTQKDHYISEQPSNAKRQVDEITASKETFFQANTFLVYSSLSGYPKWIRIRCFFLMEVMWQACKDYLSLCSTFTMYFLTCSDFSEE